MKILFWFSILMIAYTYIGYPMLVYIISQFYKKKAEDRYIYPGVSIIMSAYNEEKNIEDKIKSLLNLNYPKEKIEVLIGSDGSNDKTNEIVARYINGNIKLHIKAERQGKPSMLNVLVRQAKGEIIVFTDTRQILDKDSIKELAKNFIDPKVGSVSAELFFEKQDSQVEKGMGLYWEYEKFIRRSESRIGSMLGATGALYAIRKELFCELPKNIILDDVYIPMCAVQKGYRAIFDNNAKIYDMYAKGARDEFERKTRTLVGNFQLFMYLNWLVNPFKSPVAWQFISHKFLRLIVPYLLGVMFVSNIFIASKHISYDIFFMLQVLFYAFALVGMMVKNRNRICDIAYMFCVMNMAAVVGLWRFVTGKQKVTWERTER